MKLNSAKSLNALSDLIRQELGDDPPSAKAALANRVLATRNFSTMCQFLAILKVEKRFAEAGKVPAGRKANKAV